MKILLVTFLIFSSFQSSFKLSYTGHSNGWSDNGLPSADTWPIRFLWTEAIDSSWAEMQILGAVKTHDTITFNRNANGRWELIRYLGENDIPTLGVDIDQSKDSLHIALRFWNAGVSYDTKKDSE